MAVKDEEATKRRRKTPYVASEILEKQRFSTASEDSVSSEILEKQTFFDSFCCLRPLQ